VAQRVWAESGRDNLSVVAAGCAYYALFSIFPALSALILLYGLTADPITVETRLGMFEDLLPKQAYEVVIEQVHRLVQAPAQTHSAGAWSSASSLPSGAPPMALSLYSLLSTSPMKSRSGEPCCSSTSARSPSR
jgi:uncharacterized BrkB/YihY/UPF0761 family membrane protein